MEIQGEKTINIDGKEYWTTKSFANLTQRTERVIRKLALQGNRVNRLKGITLNGRVYIECDELFNFAFTTNGRPALMGDYMERFYLEGDELLREEYCAKR